MPARYGHMEQVISDEESEGMYIVLIPSAISEDQEGLSHI